MILHDIRIKTSEPLTIWFIGDVHIGAAGADERDFQRTIELIKADKNARFIFMGDGTDCITPLDARFNGENLHPRFHTSLDHLPQAQVDYLLSLLAPIRDRCIGYHGGNHELKIKTSTRGYDPLFDYRVFFPAETADLGYGYAITRITYEAASTHTIRLLTQHGFGGATTDGARLTRLKRMAVTWHDCDVYAMGHTHKLTVDIAPALTVPARGEMRVVEKTRVFLLTGCYLRGYQQGVAGYAEMRGYDAMTLGSPYVRFRDVHSYRSNRHVLAVDTGTSSDTALIRTPM